ncbi:MAG: tryptophan synthase subunit alpha [Bryobacterales bacterium]|nr:tryptophan synthase subunit alpha [Bryobacterales bacterium]
MSVAEVTTARPSCGRVERAFTAQRSRRSRALIAYLTAGDPSPDRTVGLMKALERGGADILELGVPFSDPIADGPVIQRASERALAAGTSVATVLALVRELRRESELPLIVFSYLNPILRYGFERFAADAAAAGVDGALLTDLTIEEAGSYVGAMRERGLDCVFLVTQTTPLERIAEIVKRSSGFVYLVSRAGVTGVSASISGEALALVKRTREKTDLPLAVGFGLSTRQHMEQIAPYAEGAVVGSAFMRLIAEHGDRPGLERKLEAMAKDFKRGLDLPSMAQAGAAEQS